MKMGPDGMKKVPDSSTKGNRETLFGKETKHFAYYFLL